jgi:hypothetical protein
MLVRKSGLWLVVILVALASTSCNSGGADEALELVDEDVLEVVDGVPRGTLDYSRMGVNSFANDGRFGSIESQLLEVRDTLRLGFVRVLFAWNDAVQGDPAAAPDFSFYDSVANALPSGVDALVVITGLPSWMSDSANWIEENPRTTFVERWVRPVVNRYAGNPRVVGWQIWNEANQSSNPDNIVLRTDSSAENYVEMLARAFSVAKDIAPGKLVVNAATTAINQGYPETLNYNRRMRDAGARSFTDVWAIHYYGKQYENVVRDNGVESFLDGLAKEVWVTESGRQGLVGQLDYVERTWPFLREKIPSINRIYYYQHTEAVPAESAFGLRTLDRISDLFINLRDR